MKLLILLLLLSSCTVVPSYDIKKIVYCKQQRHDTICPGYDEREYDRESIYDI